MCTNSVLEMVLRAAAAGLAVLVATGRAALVLAGFR
jgi:hypothetical protein